MLATSFQLIDSFHYIDIMRTIVTSLENDIVSSYCNRGEFFSKETVYNVPQSKTDYSTLILIFYFIFVHVSL